MGAQAAAALQDEGGGSLVAGAGRAGERLEAARVGGGQWQEGRGLEFGEGRRGRDLKGRVLGSWLVQGCGGGKKEVRKGAAHLLFGQFGLQRQVSENQAETSG